MILEKVKNTVSNFSNFYASEFIPSSRQYFEKRIINSYSLISFKKEDIVLDNQFNINLDHLIEKFPFITDLQNYRIDINSFEEYISISHLLIKNYFNRVESNNTLYYLDSTSKKDSTFAKNVAYNSRMEFYINIESIFFFIEKKYSYELANEKNNIEIKDQNNKHKNIKPFIDFFKSKTKYNETLELLIQNNFYPKNRNLKAIELNIFLLKLEKLNLFKHSAIQKEIVFSAQNEFKVKPYGEENYSRLKNSYEKESFTKTDEERFSKLEYLNVLISNKI